MLDEAFGRFEPVYRISLILMPAKAYQTRIAASGKRMRSPLHLIASKQHGYQCKSQ